MDAAADVADDDRAADDRDDGRGRSRRSRGKKALKYPSRLCSGNRWQERNAGLNSVRICEHTCVRAR